MLNRFTPAIIVLILILVSCNRTPDKDWTHTVPADVPALILAPAGATISDMFKADHMPLFDDMSSASLIVYGEIEKELLNRAEARAMLVFPSKSTDWHPVFIGKVSDNALKTVARRYQRPFTENQYRFEGTVIHRMFIQNRIIFGAQLRNWIILSESSAGVEESVRSYLGIRTPMALSDAVLTKGELIINSAYIDRLVGQIAAVRYKPAIEHSFTGTGIGNLNVTMTEATGNRLPVVRISGGIPLPSGERSNLIAAVSHQNRANLLDRYIPSDAAMFALFNAPASASESGQYEPATRLDSLLVRDPGILSSLAATLSPEFAFATFYTPGFISENENVYIRRISNHGEFFRIINRLASEGHIIQNNDSYYVRSEIMARLLGSPFCHYSEFYITEAGQAVVLSRRLGLAQRVRGDFSRRRVMHFDDTYSAIRGNLPSEMSGFLYVNSANFSRNIASMLAPSNYLNAITSRFDIATASLQLNAEGNGLLVNFQTHRLERSRAPYQDLWVHPLQGAELTGKTVFADISGNNRDEVLFATTNGEVLALATDGSVVFQASTGSDVPVGSPIVYDWYANNQKAVIVAAGNRIYAWNNRGVMLPNFPFELPEQITAPVEIADITRSGLPEIVVATADRRMHILSGRGQNIPGWPQSVNATVQSRPVVANVDGRWGVWAYAQNAIHAWEANGDLRNHFPFFATSPFSGSPVFLNNSLLAGTADGRILALGSQPLFSDTLASVREYGVTDPDQQPPGNGSVETTGRQVPGGTRPFSAQYIQVTNTPVTIAGVYNNSRLRNEEGYPVSETVFLVQGNNGSLFVYNHSGILRNAKSTGQPATSADLPFMTDLNSDGWPEVIAVATFGRLYGWSMATDEPVDNLPPAGMRFPAIHDMSGDGLKNLIAQTRDGLRSWQINR